MNVSQTLNFWLYTYDILFDFRSIDLIFIKERQPL